MNQAEQFEADLQVLIQDHRAKGLSDEAMIEALEEAVRALREGLT